MEEIVLGGDVKVLRRELGGCNLAIQTSPDRLYRLPLDPESQAFVAALLSMSDEELDAEHARLEAAARIQVARPDAHARPEGRPPCLTA